MGIFNRKARCFLDKELIMKNNYKNLKNEKKKKKNLKKYYFIFLKNKFKKLIFFNFLIFFQFSIM